MTILVLQLFASAKFQGQPSDKLAGEQSFKKKGGSVVAASVCKRCVLRLGSIPLLEAKMQVL